MLFSIFPLSLADDVEWRSKVDMLVEVEPVVFGRRPKERMPRIHNEKVSYLSCHVVLNRQNQFGRMGVNRMEGNIGLNSHGYFLDDASIYLIFSGMLRERFA